LWAVRYAGLLLDQPVTPAQAGADHPHSVTCDSAMAMGPRLRGGDGEESDHPAHAWRRAGLMAVTGNPDGPGLVCPLALTSAADGALLALRHLAPEAALPANGALLLGERARMLGLSRQGRTAANGSCRLLDTADGRVAINLARADDWGLLPALVEAEVCDWGDLAAQLRLWTTDAIVARGAELGLAIAADRPARPQRRWCRTLPGGSVRRKPHPLVLDLSSLWAGPLAGSLLAMLGAEVVKLESAARPDGARAGHGGFFALLNGMKRHVVHDFADRAGLVALVAAADIIIEGSRPRALQQLGIDARREVARGAVWIGITGHGRDGANALRVGFGDDAAVAGGLASAMAAGWGEALFAGDAIADPLTGIHAALAGWQAWQGGRGALIDVSLRRTVAFAARAGRAPDVRAWQALAKADTAALYPLRAPC
jgi:crotonobetainyl-CoA:carnitine CoA-transferase CaiB-like acyl-CoA transferase